MLTVAELRAVFSADTSDLDRAQARVRSDAEKTASSMSRSYSQAGEKSAEGWVRGADGRLRNAQGRFVSAGEQAAAGLDTGMGKGTSKIEARLQQLGRRSALLLGGAAVTGLAKSVSLAKDYDLTIRQIGVATDTGGRKLKGLSDLALKAGADTVFSAQDAGDAMLDLAKGGLTAAQIKAGALRSTMTLAAAGSIGLGDAADYVVQGLSMFSLKAKDTDRVTTALAGGANASTASVESLGQALSQVGPGARNSGFSLEDTVATLAAFSQEGIKGSDAGTSLKTMLANLVPQTKQSADAMKAHNLEFVNADGSFKSLGDIAQQLQDRLGGLSEAQKTSALNTIFGTDASRAAGVLMDLGEKGLKKYTSAVRDQNQAQKMANATTEGASGAWENFKGAAETAGIKLGTELLPTITDGLKWFTNEGIPDIEKAGHKIKQVVGFFEGMPGPAKSTAVHIAEITTAAGVALVAAKKLGDAWGVLKGGASVLSGGRLGQKAAGGALGSVLGSAKPVPVYVTNPGFGGTGADPLGGGKSGGGTKSPAPVGGGKSAAILGGALVLSQLGSASNEKLPRDFSQRARLYSGVTGALNPGLGLKATETPQNLLGLKIPARAFGIKIPASYSHEMADYKTNLTQIDDAYQKMAEHNPSKTAAELAEKAKKAGVSFGDLLTTLPRTRASLDAYAVSMKKLPKALRTEIAATGVPKTSKQIADLTKKYNLTPDEVRTLTTMKDRASPFINRILKAMGVLNHQTATPRVNANTAPARAAISGFLGYFNSLDGRVVTTTVTTNHVDVHHTKQGAPALNRLLGTGSARGNFFSAYADGGMTGGDVAGMHMPEYATPTAHPRVWLEPETQGESYIPHANDSRRPRARDILARTAAKFGGRVEYNATGSITTSPTGGTTGMSVADYTRMAAAWWAAAEASTKVAQATKSTTAGNLAYLQAQKTVQDARKALTERDDRGRYTLGGLDRRVGIAELRQAQSDLKVAAKAARDVALSEKATSLRDQITSAQGVFGTGATTASQLLRNLSSDVVTNSQYGGVLAELKKSGLSKGLLAQFEEAGPTAQSLALGKSILASGTIDDLNDAAAALKAQATALAAQSDGRRTKSPAVNIEKFITESMSPDEVAARLAFKLAVQR